MVKLKRRVTVSTSEKQAVPYHFLRWNWKQNHFRHKNKKSYKSFAIVLIIVIDEQVGSLLCNPATPTNQLHPV